LKIIHTPNTHTRLENKPQVVEFVQNSKQSPILDANSKQSPICRNLSLSLSDLSKVIKNRMGKHKNTRTQEHKHKQKTKTKTKKQKRLSQVLLKVHRRDF